MKEKSKLPYVCVGGRSTFYFLFTESMNAGVASLTTLQSERILGLWTTQLVMYSVSDVYSRVKSSITFAEYLGSVKI